MHRNLQFISSGCAASGGWSTAAGAFSTFNVQTFLKKLKKNHVLPLLRPIFWTVIMSHDS
jgi:hypothetical protein